MWASPEVGLVIPQAIRACVITTSLCDGLTAHPKVSQDTDFLQTLTVTMETLRNLTEPWVSCDNAGARTPWRYYGASRNQRDHCDTLVSHGIYGTMEKLRSPMEQRVKDEAMGPIEPRSHCYTETGGIKIKIKIKIKF